MGEGEGSESGRKRGGPAVEKDPLRPGSWAGLRQIFTSVFRTELAAVVRVNSPAMTPMGLEICGRPQLVAKALCRLEAISLCVVSPWQQSNGHAAQYYGETVCMKSECWQSGCQLVAEGIGERSAGRAWVLSA